MVHSFPFDVLCQTGGATYQQQRDQLLADPARLQQHIADYEAAPHWRQRVCSRILSGWLSHRQMYLAILEELDRVDVAWEQKGVAGLSRVWDAYALKTQREYGKDVLPLAWEAVLKWGDELPEWKVITFLHMLAAVPVEDSVDVIVWLLSNTERAGLREAAGAALSRMPASLVKPRLEALSAKTEHVQHVIQEALYEIEG
jgi:hypothetical protein